MSTISAGTTSTNALVNTGDTTGTLVFQTNGTTTAMTIDTSQNVGIGTSSPVSKLEVKGAGFIAASISGDSTSETQLRFNTNTAARISQQANQALLFDTNATERMRITSTGLVGIGTNAPGYPLDVRSSQANQTNWIASINTSATNSSAGFISYLPGVTGTPYTTWYTDFGGNAVITNTGVSGGGSILFINTGSERMRINSGGGISVYSASISFDTIDSCNNQGAGTQYSTFIGRHSSTGVGNGTVSIRIYTNGNIVNTNGSYGAISDAKMKTDIVDAGSQWDDIKAIRFRKFKIKDDPSGLVQLGVVAQELEQVSPGLIDETPDRDDKGNDLGTITKSVKTSVLLMKAAVALQEAMARIEKLEAEVAALKGAQ